uniref:Iduronate 2-sulfatase n=1 Tax=Anopheles coluzzii TaxID=1518534 RepID=A0A8W7PG61_ANOCL
MWRCKVRLLLSLLCLTFLISTTATQRPPDQPNVLLIILDDFRPVINYGYGDGNAITVNIDRLVQQGFFFQNAFAQQALCAPSRNSMLTGRRPDTVRLYDFYSYWRQTSGNYTTLPQYFKQHGYRTHSVGKVFHPGASSNFTDDFPLSWSEPAFHPLTDEYSNAAVCIDPADGRLKRNLLCPVRLETQPLHTLPDIESTEEAKRFLSTVGLSQPYFLAVGYRKPHIPFRIPAKYLGLHPVAKFATLDLDYPPYGLPTVAWSSYLDVRNRDDFRQLNVSFPFGPVPDDFKLRIRQHYYAAVTFVDELIGELLQEVDLSRTIVALTSDHGWALGEHGEWAKYSNYDAAVRIPLVIRAPGMQTHHQQKIDNVVELLDLYSTLVDLAGLPPVPRCDEQRPHKATTCTEGKSLVPLMQRNSTADGENDGDEWIAYSQYPRPGTYPSLFPNSDEPKLRHIKIMGYSMRTDRFRYTAWIKFNPDYFKRDWSTIYGEELYDHWIDPQENMNLIDRAPLATVKDALRAKLQEKFP